jgi:hypothetical protein
MALAISNNCLRAEVAQAESLTLQLLSMLAALMFQGGISASRLEYI